MNKNNDLEEIEDNSHVLATIALILLSVGAILGIVLSILTYYNNINVQSLDLYDTIQTQQTEKDNG